MSNSKLKDLKRIEELVYNKGEYYKALQMLQDLETREDLTVRERLSCQFLKSMTLSLIERPESGLKIAKDLCQEAEALNQPLNCVDGFTAMGKALFVLERHNECLNVIQQGEKLLKSLGQDQSSDFLQRQADLLFRKGTCYAGGKDDFDLGLEYTEQSLDLYKKISNQQGTPSLSVQQGIIWSLINIAAFKNRKGEPDRPLETYEQIIAQSKKFERHISIIFALNNMGETYSYYKGDRKRALEYYRQALVLGKEVNHQEGIMSSLFLIGRHYFYKGDLDRALEYFKRRLTVSEQISAKDVISENYSWMALVCAQKGEFSRAVEYIICAFTGKTGKKFTAFALIVAGWFYTSTGDWKWVLEYLERSLALQEYKMLNGMGFLKIGEIYSYTGELERALEYLQQGLALFKKIRHTPTYYITLCLTRIGTIYRQQGDFEQALMYLEQSLGLQEELENRYLMSETLFYLVSVALDKKQLDRAQRYLQHLQELNAQEDNKIIRQRYQVAEALVLKSNPRRRNQVKAEALLQQVIREEILNYELTVVALLNLSDLTLDELRISGEQEVLDEVQVLVDKLREMAEQKNSYWLLAEIYLLQSKLALLELELEGAQEFLEQALHLAQEQGLKRLVIEITSEQASFNEQMSKWEHLIDRKAPLSERLELTQLEAQIVRIARRKMATTEKDVLTYAQDVQRLMNILEKSETKSKSESS
ncbi:MAG: tetratricopeptide repeat protein [Promethearchaeota archaeon]